MAVQQASSVAKGSPHDSNGLLKDGEIPSVDVLIRRNAELAERVARLTEALAARDAFIAIAGHELRNPMTPILGRVTMLTRTVARGAISLEGVAAGLEQLESLITSFIKRATALLDVSRVTSNNICVERAPVDLCELAQAVAASFHSAALHAGSTISIALPAEPITVIGDQTAIEQVLENLLSNAIKYGAGSGIRVGVTALASGGIARVTISDGGPGISPENQVRIFERFERVVDADAGIEGFGVGLWIVRHLCEAMDGAVEVASTPGSGSTFSVTLPLQARRVDE